MRTLRRPAVAVPTLKSAKVTRAANAVKAARTGSPPAKGTFPEHWKATDVRSALYAMSGRVCVYCGKELGMGDLGDVEHFRPKGEVDGEPEPSGYWWLAYEFANYLISCLVCNRNRKSTKFPLTGGSRVAWRTRAALADEKRALPEPGVDDLDTAWTIALDAAQGRMRGQVVLAQNVAEPLRTRAATAIRFFEHNVDPALFTERLKVLDAALEAHAAGNLIECRRMASRFRPHSLVARAVLSRAGIAGPTRGEEVRWFIEEVQADLLLCREIQRLEREGGMVPSGRAIRRLEECLWILAILWKAPPPELPSVEVETFLRNNQLRDEVERLYRQL